MYDGNVWSRRIIGVGFTAKDTIMPRRDLQLAHTDNDMVERGPDMVYIIAAERTDFEHVLDEQV